MAIRELNRDSQSSNALCNLREWSPLTEVIEHIPTKVQMGFFPQYVKFTCIDVLFEYIAIGTNVGIVYWYDRKSKEVQPLRCENSNIGISTIKVISTVDFMVASGSKDGNISIFQIPKSHPDSIPDSLKPKQNKKIERYTVSELHKCEITAIEWSKNGMKLFSGDKNGTVVYTEIDFYMHICKSVEILNEAYEVVQLSYSQQGLLVSTTYRSIICQKFDKWKVCQVGKKDRKLLGSFGGIIYQNGIKPVDSILYCTRPGLRIWISDLDGNVQKTLLFKDLLSKGCPEIPLINPISKTLQALKPQKEPNFGILLVFQENLLVTYNNDVVYILDPRKMCVLYKMSYLRNVISLAAYKDELFILEEDRSLIRVAVYPETFGESVSSTSLNSVTSPVASIKNITAKIHAAPIISAIPPLLEHAFGSDYSKASDFKDCSLEINAEEAKESPVLVIKEDKKFDEIGKQNFNDRILFKKSKHRRKHHAMSASTNSLSSTSSEERDNASYIRPTIMNLSTIGVLPDLRSPESIRSDIEYKEKILADILNLEKVTIPSDISRSPIPTVQDSVNGYAEIKDISNGMFNINVSKKAKISQKFSPDTLVTNPEYTVISEKCDSLINDDPKVPDMVTNPASPDSEKNYLITEDYEIPVCRRVPNDWKLEDIHLNVAPVAQDSSLSDNSLNDWELV